MSGAPCAGGRSRRAPSRVAAALLPGVASSILALLLAGSGCAAPQERLDRALEREQVSRAEALMTQVENEDALRVAEIRVALIREDRTHALRLALETLDEGREAILEDALLAALVSGAEEEEDLHAWGRLQGVRLERLEGEAERVVPRQMALPLLLWVLEQPDDALLLHHLRWSLPPEASEAFALGAVLEALDLRLYRTHYRRRAGTTRALLDALRPWLEGTVLLRKHEAIAELERRRGDAPEAIEAIRALAPDALTTVAAEVSLRGVRHASLGLHLHLAEASEDPVDRRAYLSAAARAARELGDVSRSRSLLSEAQALYPDPLAGALAISAAARTFRDEVHARAVLEGASALAACGEGSEPARWLEFEDALARSRIANDEAQEAQERLREVALRCGSAELAERGARLFLREGLRERAWPLMRMAAEFTPEDASRIRLVLRHAELPYELEAASDLLRQHVALRLAEGALRDERIGIALIDVLDDAAGTRLQNLRITLLEELAQRRPEAWHLVRPALLGLEDAAEDARLRALVVLHEEVSEDRLEARARLAAHLLQRGLLDDEIRRLLEAITEDPESGERAGALRASAGETLREAALVRRALLALDEDDSPAALALLFAWHAARAVSVEAPLAWRELLAVPGLTRRLEPPERRALLAASLEAGLDDPLLRLEYAELLLHFGETEEAIVQVGRLARVQSGRVRELAGRALQQGQTHLAGMLLDALPTDHAAQDETRLLRVRVLRAMAREGVDAEERLRWRGEERALWKSWIADGDRLPERALILLADDASGEHAELLDEAMRPWLGEAELSAAMEHLRLRVLGRRHPQGEALLEEIDRSVARLARTGSAAQRLEAWALLLRSGLAHPDHELALNLAPPGVETEASRQRLEVELATRKHINDAEGLRTLIEETLLSRSAELEHRVRDSRELRARYRELSLTGLRYLAQAGLVEHASTQGLQALRALGSREGELARLVILSGALAHSPEEIAGAVAAQEEEFNAWVAAANLLHEEGLSEMAEAACDAAAALLAPVSDITWSAIPHEGMRACAREGARPASTPEDEAAPSQGPERVEREAAPSQGPERVEREAAPPQGPERVEGAGVLTEAELIERSAREGTGSRWMRMRWTLHGDEESGARWRAATGSSPALLLIAAEELAPRDPATAMALLVEIAAGERSAAAAEALARLLSDGDADEALVRSLLSSWLEGPPLDYDEVFSLTRALAERDALPLIADVLSAWRGMQRLDPLGRLVRESAPGWGTQRPTSCTPPPERPHSASSAPPFEVAPRGFRERALHSTANGE